jgi:hypothetical protein
VKPLAAEFELTAGEPLAATRPGRCLIMDRRRGAAALHGSPPPRLNRAAAAARRRIDAGTERWNLAGGVDAFYLARTRSSSRVSWAARLLSPVTDRLSISPTWGAVPLPRSTYGSWRKHSRAWSQRTQRRAQPDETLRAIFAETLARTSQRGVQAAASAPSSKGKLRFSALQPRM